MSTEPESTEQPMSLSNLADGAAQRFFDQAVAQLYESFMDPDTVGMKAQITIKIDMTHMGEGSEAFFFAVQRPTLKWPGRRGAAKMVRYQSGVPVIDVLEAPDLNRRLPLSLTVTTGSKSE